MDIKKDKQTFNYLFGLFVRMGEEKLGRQLTANEINQLRPSIAKKCENIDKKYVVREIYNLEKSRKEKAKGALGIKEKINLRKKVSNYTQSRVKYTSSSKDLAKVVANHFSNIHVNDILKKHPYLKLKSPEFLNHKKQKLQDSYIKDTFHFKAPKNVSQTIKRLIALGGVGVIALGIGAAVHFKNVQNPEKEEITTESVLPKDSVEQLTPRDYLLDSIEPELPYLENYNPTLEHFKDVFTDEFNEMNNSTLSSGVITMKSRPHTFIYELTDNAGNKFYITKGNSPGTTENLLQKAGYTCKRIDDYNSDVDVISVIANDNFIAACAYIEGKVVPICADGTQFSNHAPSQQELNSGYSNIINNQSVADSQLLADLYSTGAFDRACDSDREGYVDCLLKYIEKHTNSKLAQKIISAINQHHVSKNTKKDIHTTEIEDEELEF